MKLKMLGTGHALVTECYNTCFVVCDNDRYFLVDGGGGSEILHRLKLAYINVNDIHEMFVTHKHIDHIMGMIWLIRVICTGMKKGKYKGDANIYAHEEVISLLDDMAHKLLQPKETAFIGDRLHLVTVTDGETMNIIGRDVTFFDIHSTKAKQFGFCMDIGGEKLTCCGDEPYNECEREYAENSKWLLHEAFCLYSQADVFSPYEKHHSTVKDACELAEKLNIPNLVLYHTEDKNIERRRELYTAEGKQYYSGRLYVPDDLDEIEI